MINFDTDRLIIFYYPGKAGGKFLINALGLSDQAVFQDNHMAARQLQGNFSKLEKLEYLLEKIQETKDKWFDLNLGCGQLFGKVVELTRYLKDFPLNNEVRKYFDFDGIIEPLSTSNKYFFKVAHSIHDLKKDLLFWPNAKVVELTNYDSFIKKYRSLDESKYNTVKGADWPKSYPSISQYLNLPLEIQNDINVYYPDFEHFQNNLSQSNRIIFEWNTENYFSCETTITEFENLCKSLNINDIDFSDVKVYYKAWIEKLHNLKNNRNNQ